MVRYLVLKGADVHGDGRKALAESIAKSDVGMVKYLVLECCADPRGSPESLIIEAPLMKAALSGSLEIINFLGLFVF